MWSTIVYEEKKRNPSSRSKHSLTLIGNQLYLLGGKNGNLPLKDFWKYDLVASCWEVLNPSGDIPPCLQEHTAVAYKDNIYVFGGELSFSAGNETPLWVYYTKTNKWRKICGQKGTNIPKGRRGHTTLVHNGSALIYGGYCDLRGSSNELWVFHFETESWHLMMNGRNDPPGRHKHSAILHDEGIWVYGGMTDLQERSDMWRFDIVTKKWTTIRCKISPGALHSHAACKFHSSMLIFGGERNAQPINELWRFHFGTETWERIETDAFCPQPMSDCGAVAVSELLLGGGGGTNNSAAGSLSAANSVAITNNMVNSDFVKNGNIDHTPSSSSSSVVTYELTNAADIISKDKRPSSAKNYRNSNNSSSSSNNNVSNNYLFNANFQRATYDRRSVMVPPRRQASTPNSCNLNIFREIGKLSHMNLYQNKKCNYSVLQHSNSNESINNSEESVSTELTKCYSSNIVSVSSSRSSSQTAVREKTIKNFIDDNTTDDNGSNVCSSYHMNNNNHNNNGSSDYFYYGANTAAVTPIEATKLVYLDGEQASVTFRNDINPVNNNSNNAVVVNRRNNNGSNDGSSSNNNNNNSNRRSYPSTNTVRFANPLVTPDEQPYNDTVSGDTTSTTEYASCENIHRLTTTTTSTGEKIKTPVNGNGPISFSNPIYFNNRQSTNRKSSTNVAEPDNSNNKIIDEKICKGDYVKVLSPADHMIEQTGKYESVEMRPVPPSSLSLHTNSGGIGGSSSSHNSYSSSSDKKKKYRACSAGRYNEMNVRNPSFCIFLVGGKNQSQVTVFKRPITMWKLTLTNRIY